MDKWIKRGMEDGGVIVVALSRDRPGDHLVRIASTSDELADYLLADANLGAAFAAVVEARRKQAASADLRDVPPEPLFAEPEGNIG